MRHGCMNLGMSNKWSFVFAAFVCLAWIAIYLISPKENPSGRILSGNAIRGVVKQSVERWLKIPYSNERENTFFGKSFYNLELDAAESGAVFPFGQISRYQRKKRMRGYSVRVSIPLKEGVRRIDYSGHRPVYESQRTDTVAVLLTMKGIEGEGAGRLLGVDVTELNNEAVPIHLFRPLKESECVVVFDEHFICIRNKGEKKFRGYRLK